MNRDDHRSCPELEPVLRRVWACSVTVGDRNVTKNETIATLPGGWDLAHAIRLGIKPFAVFGANSEALSESQVDSPCSWRAIFESAPVAMLQSPKNQQMSAWLD